LLSVRQSQYILLSVEVTKRKKVSYIATVRIDGAADGTTD